MTGVKNLRWPILSVLSLAVCAVVLEPRPAGAQGAGAAANRPRPADLTVPDEARIPAQTPLPVAAADNGDSDVSPDSPGGDPSADPEQPDGSDAQGARDGQRPAVQDGDLSFPAEPAQPRDGVVEAGEPEPPQDGADTVAVDMRPQDEIDLFESPPAGFDPLLFQIEDLEPILDRRPDRLFKFEPYDPVGIKLGSFIYFPEAEIEGAAFSNVFNSPRPERDVALGLKTQSRLVSNWSSHALELRSTGNWSFYDEFPSENEKGYLLEARGRLDVLRSTNVQGLVSHERTQESRSAIDASTAGEKPNVDTDKASLALTHKFNRLELQLRASLTDQDIGPAKDGFGGITTNDERDVRTSEETARATYELKPTLAVFAETAVNQRQFDTAPLSDGIKRDSDGQRYRFGLDFGDAGRILRGEISLGYGIQNPQSPDLAAVDGFLFDSNATWRVTELTALRLSGRTDISDTTTAGSGGVLTHQVGLEARHAFRRYFIGTAGVSYSTNQFGGVDIDENEWRVNLDAEYFVNREIILYGKYLHTAFASSEPDADWKSDEFRMGLRVRR